MRTSLAIPVVVLAAVTCPIALAQDTELVLSEDFSGSLRDWGLPRQPGALYVERGEYIVPVFKVRDATIEYRTKTEGQGLVELMFRYDFDRDNYYVFRIDTRRAGGDPPGFLKRQHDDPPWVLAGERMASAPSPDEWVDVKVEISGGKFRGYVNGKLAATLEDDDYSSGGIAFRRQVAPGWVDDLTISVPPGAPYKSWQPPETAKSPQSEPFTEGTWSAHWIWSPGDEDQLVRYFRKRFSVPGTVREATLVATCDNAYELHLNGEIIGGDSDWHAVEVYDVAERVHRGANLLAARCENYEPGAAGLLLEVGIITEDGGFVHITSDDTWRAAVEAPGEWAAAEYDDSDWEAARSHGKHPCSPWANQSDLRLPFLGPKQPLQLVGVDAPDTIAMGRPFEVTATWKPVQELKGPYPIVLTGRQDGGRSIDLAVVSPATPAPAWPVGDDHTETMRVKLWPDDGYFFRPGPLQLGLEVRGTFYTNRTDYQVSTVRLEKPAIGDAAPPPRIAADGPVTTGQFTDAMGRRHNWRLDDRGRIAVDGSAYIPLDDDGVYWCDAASAAGALDAVDWRQRVQRTCERGGPSGADFVRVRMTDHIDATTTDHEFSEDGGLGGNSRVMTIGDRQYRVTSNRSRLSYFAYTASCDHPRNPHLMMFQSVNDIERYTTVRIQPPWDNVGGGVYTGREYPCDGRPFEHRFLFYPRERRVRFTVSRLPNEKPIKPNSGAAVSHVWLFELVDALAARPVQVSSPPGRRRRLGLYLTNPNYLYTLYGYRGKNAAERAASLRSFIDYMQFCGMNLLAFNAVDGGDTTGTAFYDSDLWPRAEGNLLRELLPLCEANDIDLIPIVTSLSVPEGKFGFTKDSFQLDRFGDLTRFFSTRPPLPDPLRPEVQELLIRNLRELIEACGGSDAVTSVGFRVNGKIGLCYGGEKLGKSDQYTGYSEWDVSQFEEDTAIDVPHIDPTPYEWIKENCWERWVDWRCERMRDFWLRCRDVVRGYDDGLVLTISCDMPSETPAWNIYWPGGTSPLDCWRFHGIDPRDFRDEPGIRLQRGMMIAADRYFTRHGQYGENVEAMKAFHYAPGVTELYEGAEGNACELYHNYWEEFGVFKVGEFNTHFWGAATMYPFGRNYFEPIAFSLGDTNCHTIELFSWERGSFGHEHDLRSFARAFRALPWGKGEDATGLVDGETNGLWVRRFGDRIAVLNRTAVERGVRVRYAPGLRAGEELIEFGRYEVIAESAPDHRPDITVNLPLSAYELRVLGPG